MHQRAAVERIGSSALRGDFALSRPSQSPEARRRAEILHSLHHASKPLILVNAWDAGSARVIEHAGATAIATTSAGMAWSLGYADGEQVPVGDFIAACARICRAVSVPVSVDIERGFGHNAKEVCAFVAELIGVGVVGVNIEDGIALGTGEVTSPSVLCERIEALRALSKRMNARFFINARTDTYLVATRDRTARHRDTVQRARLYAAAGADGIFVPGMDVQDIVSFAAAVALPLNIYAGAGWAPPVFGLKQAGVRRISLGSGPLQSGFALLRRIASETFAQGTYTAMSRNMLSVGDVNDLYLTVDSSHGKE